MTYSAEILADSPLAWYRQDEGGSGTTLTDSSGNSRNGVYEVNGGSSAPTWVGGAIPGDRGAFYTATHGLRTATDASLQFTNGVIECWLKSPGNGASNVALIRDATSTGGWQLTTESNIHLVVSGVAYDTGVSRSVLQNGKWHHVVWRVTATDVDLWIDGSQVYTATRTGTATAAASWWRLGRNGSNADWIDTSADELAFYSTLSDTRIVAHYNARFSALTNAEKEIAADEPYAWYKCDETSGTALTDQGFGNNGTLAGSPTLGEPALGAALGTSIRFHGTSGENASATLGYTASNIWTFECLIKFNSLRSGSVNAVAQIGSESNFFIRAGDSGTTTGQWQFSTAGTSNNGDSSHVATTGVTYHVVLVSDGTHSTLYINGVQTLQVNSSSNISSGTLKFPWEFGDGRESDAWVQDVAVYTTALSTTRITAHYNAFTPPTLSPSGIASGQAFGTAALTPGAVTVSPSGVASAEATGTLTVTRAIVVSPAGIASAETEGTPGVSLTQVGVVSITSAEAFGTAVVQPGAISLGPAGIASAEAVGSPRIPAQGDPFSAPIIIVTSGSRTVTNLGSTLEPGEPELQGGADSASGTIWFRYVPTTSGTLEIDTSGLPGYAAVLEAFSGEESFPTLQQIGVADAATGLTIAVGEGQAYRLRLYPMTAGDERNDIPLSWTFTARDPVVDNADGVLDSLTLDITPAYLLLDLGNGVPGDVIDFYLDGDFGTLVLEDDFDDNGTLIGASIPVDERPAGDYVLNIRSGSYSLDMDFTILSDPETDPEEPTDPDEVLESQRTDPVIKWRIRDAIGVTFEFLINPEEMTSPRAEHTYTVEASTAPDGQPITWQGINKAAEWTFSGYLTDPDQIDALRDLAELNRRVWVYDHFNRRALVSLENFECVPASFRAPERPYLQHFTMHTIAYTTAHFVDEQPEVLDP